MRRSRESRDRADGRISDSFSGHGHCRLGAFAVALTVSIVTYLRDKPKLIVNTRFTPPTINPTGFPEPEYANSLEGMVLVTSIPVQT